MWNPFKKTEPEVEKVVMTPGAKDIIRKFADGDELLREMAIQVYRLYIPHLGSYNSTPEMNFMSEVDNPVPDYALRARYREILLDK